MKDTESIERLRQWLKKVVERNGSFTHPEVLKASELVDRAIVRIHQDQLRAVLERNDE